MIREVGIRCARFSFGKAREATARSSGAIVLIVRPFHRPCPEIPDNSINIDKFTGLFDKLLKIHLVKNSCKMLKNKDFMNNMSVGRSDKAPRNFFTHRIYPQIR